MPPCESHRRPVMVVVFVDGYVPTVSDVSVREGRCGGLNGSVRINAYGDFADAFCLVGGHD